MATGKRKQSLAADAAANAGLKAQEDLEKEYETMTAAKDPLVMQYLTKIHEFFHLFDQTNQGTIDVREVGTVTRALGLFPSEAEVQEIIQVVEDPSTQGMIKYERFAPYAVKMMMQTKLYQRPPDAQIETAFLVLDTEKLGYLDLQGVRDVMLKEGEPFSQDEFDDFLRFGFNEDEQKFDWREYMKKLGLNVSED